jgi:two-component system sensor histidine kinase ChiS
MYRTVVRRRLPPVLVIALPFLLVVSAVLGSCGLLETEPTVLDNGVIEYDPAAGYLVPHGPWQRYEGSLDESQLGSQTPTLIMAQTRAALFTEGDDRSTDRSYRLRIALPGPPSERVWMLFLPAIGPATRIFVDGQPVDSGGKPISFISHGSALSILVQVPAGEPGLEANRLTPGIAILGEARRVSLFLVLGGELTILIVGTFALSGLLLLLLFNLWTKNREFLAFALLLIAEAVRYLANAIDLLPFGPALPIDPDLVQALAFDLQFAAMAWLFGILAAERDRFPSWIAALPVPFLALAAIVFPDRLILVHSIGLSFYAIYCLASFGFLLAFSLRGSKRARWLLAAPLFLLAALPLRLLYADSPGMAYLVEPLTTVLFALVMVFGLLRKIRYSFQKSESLTDYVSDVAETVKRFIPQEFLQALDKTKLTDLRLGDHVKKDMTIFFSDIRAFTELSEQLTVEENFAFINSYLARVVPIIKENGGFIDKYIGDAIMALFPGPEGPDEAIRSAIDMQGKINEYNGHRAKMGYRSISMGVGIHAGSLMLGVVGVENRMENTVISDAVNLASRLQAITKAFNISLAISEEVFKSVKDPGAYTFRFIGKVRVKGKFEPVSVFEIFDGIEPARYERKVKANTFFEQGMLAYYQKDFSGAMYYFKRVLETMPEDGAASFYLDTCMNKASL